MCTTRIKHGMLLGLSECCKASSKMCQMYDCICGKNAFIVGTDNFQPGTLCAHALSDVCPGKAPVQRVVQVLNKATLVHLTHLLR